MKNPFRRFAAAYTLGELLVTIAIIALLLVGGAAVIGQLIWLAGQILWVLIQLLPLLFVIFFTIVVWQGTARFIADWELKKLLKQSAAEKKPGFFARLFSKPAPSAPPAEPAPATPPPAPPAPVA